MRAFCRDKGDPKPWRASPQRWFSSWSPPRCWQLSQNGRARPTAARVRDDGGPSPNWLTIIVFKDGTQAFFDGPKDMFRFYFDIASTGKRHGQGHCAIHVTDYYTTALVKAGDVLFVLGSDVRGPMGHELVPVKGEKEGSRSARTITASGPRFRRDHARRCGGD